MKYIFTPQFIAHHLELKVLPLIDNAYLANTIAETITQYEKSMEWYRNEHWVIRFFLFGPPSAPDIEKLRRDHVNYQSAIQGWINMFRLSQAEFVSLDYTELCRYKLEN